MRTYIDDMNETILTHLPDMTGAVLSVALYLNISTVSATILEIAGTAFITGVFGGLGGYCVRKLFDAKKEKE